MNTHRGPHFLAKCPFFVSPEDPLSATASIAHCVACVTQDAPGLKTLCEDFRQTAFLTVIEETPNYNPHHRSKASFITFIKSKVCCALWQHRRQEQKYLACGDVATDEATDTADPNPLTEALRAGAERAERLEDAVICHLETERFRAALPALLTRLTPAERTALTLKYFHAATGKAIARELRVSPGRVSQLLKSAREKIKNAFHVRAETASETA